jgi:hypothetical protein
MAPSPIASTRVFERRGNDCSRISVYGLPPLINTSNSKVRVATASVYSLVWVSLPAASTVRTWPHLAGYSSGGSRPRWRHVLIRIAVTLECEADIAAVAAIRSDWAGNELSPEPALAQASMLAGTVFLSNASEDVSPVERISSTLRTAGIEG